MSAHAEPRDEDALQRAWWLRLIALLLAPRAVFVALRDDSNEAAQARQEPIALVAALAGVAGVLWTPVARHLLNDPAFGTSVIPVWAFIGGTVYALVFYWLVGLILHGGLRALGSHGTYRRTRHLLGLAAAPLALSLLTLWPLRLAIYGSDLFRTGGDDYGRGDAIFGGLNLGFLAWSVLLLAVGVRAVHGWSWARSLAALSIAGVLPALLFAVTTL